MLKNSTPGEVACIWHIERVQIDAIKFERTQIHFLATFSLPSSSSLLKVPLICLTALCGCVEDYKWLEQNDRKPDGSELSQAGDRGFLKATKSKTPGYYHRQLQGKNFQDDQFSAYLFHLSRKEKFWWQPCKTSRFSIFPTYLHFVSLPWVSEWMLIGVSYIASL